MNRFVRFVARCPSRSIPGVAAVALTIGLTAGCSFDSGAGVGGGASSCENGTGSEDARQVCPDGSAGPADTGAAADAGEMGDPGAGSDSSETIDSGDEMPPDTTGDSTEPDTGEETAPDGCVLETWYLDDDGDGFGTSTDTAEACEAPDGYVGDDGDCDDSDASVNPSASEDCNDVDDDCDGTTDEGCSCTYDPTEANNLDGDDSHAGGVCTDQSIQESDGTCSEPSNFEKQMPGEATCDGLDNDCDGDTDEDIEQSCYSGKSGTAGTGICTEGSRTCSGGSFGACQNETIQSSAPPTSEVDCSNGDDDDCDGTADDCFFRDTISGDSSVRINDLAVDSSTGAIYAVGTERDFTNPGANRFAVVAKYDTSGNQKWINRQLGDDIAGTGIALDTDEGKVFITGQASSALPDAQPQGGTDAFIARYDLSGEREDIEMFGTGDDESANDISYDPDSESVVVGGATSGDYDGSNAGNLDAFVASFDQESLNREWASQFGQGRSENVEALDVDESNGDVYVGGDTLGAIKSSATNQGSGDIYVARYDTDGNRQWITQSGSSGDDDVRGVSVEDGVGVYVVGETEGDLESITNAGDDDAFVLKWSSSDSLEWFEGVSTGSHDDYDAVRYDPDSGDVFAVGSSAGTPDSVSLAGRYDVLVASYSASGSRNWIELRGTAEGDDGRAVGTSSNSSLLAIGGLWNWSSRSGDGFVSRIQ